jgi:DNA phosphorothioation-associated putative methyltransferase
VDWSEATPIEDSGRGTPVVPSPFGRGLALDRLEPLLRVYEGCARAYLGEMEGANIIKLHRFSGKVSYLFYPTFDTDAHPVLLRSLKLSLRTLQLDCYDYTTTPNPPILHRKEAFVPEDYPQYETFARLTRDEEEHGLLAETARIGTRQGWEERLHEAGVGLDGHRLVHRREGGEHTSHADEDTDRR